jgi:hypothetical protein
MIQTTKCTAGETGFAGVVHQEKKRCLPATGSSPERLVARVDISLFPDMVVAYIPRLNTI